MKILKLRSNLTEGHVWIPLTEIGAFYTDSHKVATGTIIHLHDYDFCVKETPDQIVRMIASATWPLASDRVTIVQFDPVDQRAKVEYVYGGTQ